MKYIFVLFAVFSCSLAFSNGGGGQEGCRGLGYWTWDQATRDAFNRKCGSPPPPPAPIAPNPLSTQCSSTQIAIGQGQSFAFLKVGTFPVSAGGYSPWSACHPLGTPPHDVARREFGFSNPDAIASASCVICQTPPPRVDATAGVVATPVLISSSINAQAISSNGSAAATRTTSSRCNTSCASLVPLANGSFRLSSTCTQGSNASLR